MFLDKAKIKIQSGRGGNGIVAWRREKYVDKGGPAGGNGGKGGDVYLIATEDLTTLLDFKFQSVFKAENGENGYIKTQHGKCGKDLYIKVPLGTIVKDFETGKIIADLNSQGQTIMVAQGGRGGRGNACFATPQKRAPQFCEPGENGIERTLELELKLIADVGLLGMPNAGKSTLISAVSSAKPKIADYPFTTLVPNLGVVRKDNSDSYVLADIPGLIEGASEGTGLGHEFLRHVERCRFLIHLVDLAEENPIKNYKIINEELKKHSQKLSEVYQVIALNKIDAVDESRKNELKDEFSKISNDVFLISAVTGENLAEFMHFVSKKVDEIPKPVIEIEVEEDDGAKDNDDSSYTVYKTDKHTYSIEGGKIFRLANVTDSRNTEQLYRFQNILKSMGVFDALKEAGIQEGDIVKIGHLEFDYLY
ncbi:MAG: GTPase ObgE [Candidatus Gastranaerophilales bacterium]|nr:GTPase ObgE [Candidatus Gastranaerophilales bacterium]